MSFREQVVRSLSFLFDEQGFVFSDESGSDDESVAVAESGGMRVRFIRDRADFFVDVGRTISPNDWQGLYDVLDILRRQGRLDANYKYANKMEPLSSALKRNYAAVREYLASR